MNRIKEVIEYERNFSSEFWEKAPNNDILIIGRPVLKENDCWLSVNKDGFLSFLSYVQN